MLALDNLKASVDPQALEQAVRRMVEAAAVYVVGLRRSFPVAAYVAVITVMAAFALASGSVVAAAGAMAFMSSDALIAQRRFVADAPWISLAVIVLYHLGQLGLVTYLIG